MTLQIKTTVRIPMREEGWPKRRNYRVNGGWLYEVVPDAEWDGVDPIDNYRSRMKASFADLVRAKGEVVSEELEEPEEFGEFEPLDDDSLEYESETGE